MKKLYAIIFFSLFLNSALAQKQAWKWYFSNNAAMDFSTGVPVALFDNAMYQYEGSSSIADENGDLLFYSDGITVWNKNHLPMPNGTGMLGNYSSTQSALIVPKPGSTTIYYIFVTDETSTAHYSELDITLDGGLGDITANKNILLNNNCNEKLAAVRSANGQDIWVAVHEVSNSNFAAYLVTSSGVGAAVVSNVGNQIGGGPGQLKFSPNGKRAALGTLGSETIDLYDFDNSTGIFSHPVALTTVYNQTYGLEFSPNSKVLYSGEFPGTQNVHQWNLDLPDSLIQLSDATIGISLGSTASFQLAVDGKIYFAQDGASYVGSISNPDVYGGAGYDNMAINVSPKVVGLGLPNFIASLFQPVNAEHFCFGDATNFYFTDSALYTSVYWNFGDSASGAANIDSGINVFHVFSDTGEYTVQVAENFSNGSVDTLYTTITIVLSPLVNLGNDTSICEGDSLFIDAGNAGSSFLWSDGSVSQTLLISAAGIYSVAVSDGTCTGVDTIVVSTINCNQLPAFAASDTDVCEKFCVDYFDLTLNSFEWHWTFEGGSPSSSTNQNPTSICYNFPGTYDVTLIFTNANGTDTLTLPDYLTVYATPPPPAITQAGYTLTSSAANSYQWQFNSTDIPGATNQSYTVLQSGYYTVIVGDANGCINSWTTYVLISGIEDADDEAGIFIYPNPSSGSFIVEWLNGLMADEVQIDVVNTLGQIIFSSADAPSIGTSSFSEGMHSDKKEIDLSNMVSGVYFIEIKTTNVFARKKILLVH
ncbi:MAG TPA: T9SS type A sorting domain-containing protein [Chitinophagales bacterium]|nr:T9SS type A sorting domain-containing protein [Chitinophagales bacterium]